jgi:hypothetical protein
MECDLKGDAVRFEVGRAKWELEYAVTCFSMTRNYPGPCVEFKHDGA